MNAMMALKASALLASLFLHGANAHADCEGNNCRNVEIERIYAHGTNNVVISTSGDEKALNCEPGNGIYLRLLKTDPGYDEIFSIILASKLSGQKLWVRTKETPGSRCTVMYVVLE